MKDDKAFRRAYNKGRYCVNEAVSVYFLKNRTSENRLGITTGKKIGGAVERNRARRIIRAAYRSKETLFPIGIDIVFVARPAIVSKKSTDIESFIERRLVKEMNRLLYENAGNNAKGQAKEKKKEENEKK